MVQVKRLTGVRPMRLPEGSLTEPGLPDVPIYSTDATLMPRWWFKVTGKWHDIMLLVK